MTLKLIALYGIGAIALVLIVLITRVGLSIPSQKYIFGITGLSSLSFIIYLFFRPHFKMSVLNVGIIALIYLGIALAITSGVAKSINRKANNSQQDD